MEYKIYPHRLKNPKKYYTSPKKIGRRQTRCCCYTPMIASAKTKRIQKVDNHYICENKLDLDRDNLKHNSYRSDTDISLMIHHKSTPTHSPKNYTSRSKSADYYKKRNESSQLSGILNPDIYSDSEDGQCQTIVRKTNSAIKWPKQAKPGLTRTKKSKFHLKCDGKTVKKKIRHKSIMRNTVVSDTQDENLILTRRNFKTKFENECYCIKSPKKIQLPCSSPKKYASNSNRTSPTRFCSTQNEKPYGKKTLKTAKDILNYNPESIFLKRLKKANYCRCDKCLDEKWKKSLKYTDRREVLEKAYKDLEEERKKYRSCYQECIKGVPKNDTHFSHVSHDESTEDLLDELKTNIVGRLCNKIHKANKIRKDNYFDTHSTENFTHSDVPPHRCVHKFELDDRLLPKPLNADIYGTSRCTFCNKPMKYSKKVPLNSETSSNISKTKQFTGSYYSDTKSAESKPRNTCYDNFTKSGTSCYSTTPQCRNSRHNLLTEIPYLVVPSATCTTKTSDTNLNTGRKSALRSNLRCTSKQRRINLGNNNEIIDINFGPKVKFRECREKYKPNVPTDSLALRYQKGIY